MLWITALVLMTLSRSAVLSVIAFTTLDLAWRLLHSQRPTRDKALFIAIYGPVLAFVTLFYLPAFLTFTSVGTGFAYYGVVASDYADGLLAPLPSVLDQAISTILLLAAKVLYFTGLRPSYSDVAPLIVTVRAAVGLILLPGLIYVLWHGPVRQRLLVALVVLPLLLGVSQDRYNLPIQPILFLYGVRVFETLWRRWRDRRAVPAP